jgi:uncharacterized membrane protein YccC
MPGRLSLRGRISRHRPKAVQALRMTLSGLGALALASALDLAQGFWAVITALIVSQSSVGGSLKAAWERFLGSVFGAVYGGAVALAIPHAGGWSRAIALIAAVAPLSVIAAFSAGFRIAPITAIIVLLTPTGAALGPVGFAADRVLEIGLGCAVGLLISILIVPARASQTVLETSARIARLLADQFEALAASDQDAQADLADLAMRVRKGLNQLEALLGEAARERLVHLTATRDPEALFRGLMRLRHDLVMLRRAAHESDAEERLAPAWARAARAAAAALTDIAEALPRRRAPRPSTDLAEAVAAYQAAIDDMRQRGLTRSLSTDAVGRIFGLAFALDQLRRDVEEFAAAARELFDGSSGLAPA